MIEDDPFADLKAATRLTPAMVAMIAEHQTPKGAAAAARKNRNFVMVPWAWFERLQGATGGTYAVALTLLWLSWRQKGGAVRLSNQAPGLKGISRYTKRRALTELERWGLISVVRSRHRSPVIRVNSGKAVV